MDKLLQTNETFLEGKWVESGGKVIADEVAKRVEHLVTYVLKKIEHSQDGWDTLYQDPADGRYWEHFYLQSEMHGGGPPSLKVISSDAAKKKYAIK